MSKKNVYFSHDTFNGKKLKKWKDLLAHFCSKFHADYEYAIEK